MLGTNVAVEEMDEVQFFALIQKLAELAHERSEFWGQALSGLTSALAPETFRDSE